MAPRHRRPRALLALFPFAMALFPFAMGLACASGPLASFQAARLYGRGSAALERGEPERAIADLKRASDLAPHASEIQNHLGAAYAAAGRDAEALAAFRRAVALDCANDAARANLRAAQAGGGS